MHVWAGVLVDDATAWRLEGAHHVRLPWWMLCLAGSLARSSEWIPSAWNAERNTWGAPAKRPGSGRWPAAACRCCGILRR